MQLEIRPQNEGSAFDLLGVRFLTKAGGDAVNKAFYIAEMMFPVGAGIPLHHHPEPECFYVLAGACEFGTIEGGSVKWTRSEAGDSILIPIDVPHGLRNESGADARLLVISTHRHELFFQKAGTVADATKPPRPATAEDLEHVLRTAARYDTYAAAIEPSFTPGSIAVTPTLKMIPRCFWRLEPLEKPYDFLL